MPTTTIHNLEVVAESDVELLIATIHQARRWSNSVNRIQLHCAPRRDDGWLEYLLVVRDDRDKHKFTLGCIQRLPGAVCEFHS